MLESERTQFATPVYRQRIKVNTPRTRGPVCTCPKCRTSFRAESRKKAECPYCGYRFLGGM